MAVIPRDHIAKSCTSTPKRMSWGILMRWRKEKEGIWRGRVLNPCLLDEVPMQRWSFKLLLCSHSKPSFLPLLPVDVTNTIYFTWNAISFLLYRKGTAPFLSVPMSLFLLPFCLKDTSILLPLAPLLTPANSCHNIPFTLLSLPVYLTVPSETDFPEQRSHFISPLILHHCHCASFIDVW